MRIDFKFRHSTPSDELTSYVSERISKLEKFELRPVHVALTFSAEKSTLRVDVHVRGQDIEMHAHSDGDDYFSCVDVVLEKIARQLSRKKAKIKNRKVPAPKVS